MQIYNTLTRKPEPFDPIDDKKVNFFVCGPTVYDAPHLGHAKTYTQFDFIVRYLRFKGYDVYYLINITDIDDKIIQKAKRKSTTWKEIAREYEAVFRRDMEALHNTSVTKYARASDFIPAIVRQVEQLLEKEYAYRTSDGIYYDLSKFPEYGKLSGRTQIEEDDAVSRIDESPDKRNWNDFCLWKARKAGEPFWETALGEGRPGWHIEDTAITESFFGSQYDVHGGAVDLIFPHHEAEIAQMEAASGVQPLVRHWLHTGFLTTQAEKMSKSDGNFTTIDETLAQYSYKVLRFLFLSSHYRSSIEFNPHVLEQAEASLQRINEFLFKADPTYDDSQLLDGLHALETSIYSALDSDFDTPQALASIFSFVREQNAEGQRLGRHTLSVFKKIDALFDVMDFEQNFVNEEIQSMIAEREQHRARKEYGKADAIREQIEALGIKLYDTDEGVRWRKVVPETPLPSEEHSPDA